MNDMDILTQILLDEADDLTEVTKRPTKSKELRGTKIKRATSQMASAEAKHKEDPLYKRMVYFRDLYYKYRDTIKKKYGPKNLNRARE